jgi:GNAT superfamily N-acetyltransferase
MTLARLAVDRTHQKAGLGNALLNEALLLRTLQATDIAAGQFWGMTRIDTVLSWYEGQGFETNPTDSYHLLLLLKDLKALLSS